MATRVWNSSTIAAPIAAVWNLVRPVDFRYLGTVADVSLEERSSSPSTVRAIRKVHYTDKTVQRIKLLELSDADFAVSWELLESVPAVTFLGCVHSVRRYKLQAIHVLHACRATQHSSNGQQISRKTLRWKVCIALKRRS